jgi:hypothetical protein
MSGTAAETIEWALKLSSWPIEKRGAMATNQLELDFTKQCRKTIAYREIAVLSEVRSRFISTFHLIFNHMA